MGSNNKFSKKKIAILALSFFVFSGLSGWLYWNKAGFSYNADLEPGTARFVSVSSTQTMAGTDRTVSLAVSAMSPICSVDYVFNYPIDLYELKGAPSIIGQFNVVSTADYSVPGKIHYVQSAPGCYTIGDRSETILRLVFQIKSVGTSSMYYSELKVTGGVSGDESFNIDPVSLSNRPITTVDSPSEDASAVTTTSTSDTIPDPTNTNVNTSAAIATPKKITNTNNKTATAPPVVVPTAVSTVTFTENVVFDAAAKTATGILFTGTAEPDSIVHITIKSDPIISTALADASGVWGYEVGTPLTDGVHTITISSTKEGRTSAESTTEFVVDSSTKSIALGSILQNGSSGTGDATLAVPISSTTGKKADMRLPVIVAIVSISLFFIVVAVLCIVGRKRKRATGAIVGSVPNQNVSNIDFSQEEVKQVPVDQLTGSGSESQDEGDEKKSSKNIN